MRFMQRNSVKFALVLFAFVVLAGTGRAGEIKYPPYPDFWGRALPVSEDLLPTMRRSNIYHNPDGDRLIQFGYDNPLSSDGRDWRLRFTFSFFGGQFRQINPKEANRLSRAYWDTGRLYKRSKVDNIS